MKTLQEAIFECKHDFIAFGIFLIFVFLAGCKKDDVTYVPEPTIQEMVEGYDWILSDGRVYVERLSVNDRETIYYDHFGTNSNESNLDIFGGSSLPINNLIRNVTQWRFHNHEFILDNTNFYDFTVFSDSIYNVIGLEDGSSKSITILYVDAITLTVKLHEAFESDGHGGTNYRYFSTLTFVKRGEVCTNCQQAVFPDYIYGGIILPSQDKSELEGTTWVITKFINNFATQFPNDTLRFNSHRYTINGGAQRNYNLTGGFGNNMSTLTLYGCTTFGGDYSGMVLKSFIEDREINNTTFEELFNANNRVIAFLMRIE